MNACEDVRPVETCVGLVSEHLAAGCETCADAVLDLEASWKKFRRRLGYGDLDQIDATKRAAPAPNGGDQ
ncbi:MAG: hypothetical protein GY719_30270 [bacterium]|nr:hypothetical protein [bacterium]